MAVGVAVTVINIAVGTYFVAMIVFAIDTYRFLFDPVPAVVRCRLHWAGWGTLCQEQQSRPLAQAAPSGTEDGARAPVEDPLLSY